MWSLFLILLLRKIKRCVDGVYARESVEHAGDENIKYYLNVTIKNWRSHISKYGIRYLIIIALLYEILINHSFIFLAFILLHSLPARRRSLSQIESFILCLRVGETSLFDGVLSVIFGWFFGWHVEWFLIDSIVCGWLLNFGVLLSKKILAKKKDANRWQ